jgi:hypothetical protein
MAVGLRDEGVALPVDGNRLPGSHGKKHFSGKLLG